MSIMWHPSFAIGITQIDQEHHALFDQLEQLLNAILQGDSANAANGMLEFLSRYVEEHFAHEEELMRNAGYPGLLEHQAHHQWFTHSLELLKQEFAVKGSYDGALSHLVSELSDWLTGHVLEVDQRMGVFLKGKGIT